MSYNLHKTVRKCFDYVFKYSYFMHSFFTKIRWNTEAEILYSPQFRNVAKMKFQNNTCLLIFVCYFVQVFGTSEYGYHQR